MGGFLINRIFSDHMVLQRQKPIYIWGTCRGQKSIKVTLGANTVEADIQDERWTAVLPPMETQIGLTMTVQAGDEARIIRDIAIGEVWIAGGQSNMEFYMKYERGYAQERMACENENIRFFDVPELCYPGHEEDFDFSRMGLWRTCDAKNLEYYSAVAYYFAKHLQRELQVPVGIIGCNRGESPVASWLPEDIAATYGDAWQQDFENGLNGKRLEEALEEYRHSEAADRGNPFADEFSNRLLYGISHEEQEKFMESAATAPEPKPIVSFHTKPGSLYENMLLSIVPYAARGIIWYQGETDSQHPDCYKTLWSKMMDCWRELWKEELPFLCVQLAPFEQWLWCTGEQFPAIRRIQQEICTEKSQVYLVSSSDSGMRYDIHPKNKEPIGTRLALCAEKNIYGKNIFADAPIAVEAYRDAEDLCIRFVCDTDEMELRGDITSVVEITRQNRPVSENLSGNAEKVDLSGIRYEVEGLVLRWKNLCSKIPGKWKVSIAQTGYYDMTLYSAAGIPAMPSVCEIRE